MKKDKHSNSPFRVAHPEGDHHWPLCENRSLIGDSASDERSQRRRVARFLARLRKAVLPVVVVLAGVWGIPAKGLDIMARLEPAEIAFGDAAQLMVTVRGQDSPAIPEVNGLSFQPAGRSSQVQVSNGSTSATSSYTYLVSPNRPGTFTIPGIRGGSGTDLGQTRSLVLKVLQRSTGSFSTTHLPARNQTGQPMQAPNEPDDESAAPDSKAFGFLRLVSPKREFYVGEMVPVELQAYFRTGVELRVDGLPRLNSDAFTMNKLSDQPARSQRVIGDVPYTVLTWTTAITAVKAGDYEMSVEIPTTVTVRQRAQRPKRGNPFGDSFFDEMFNDSFFDSFFGSATKKEVALSSPSSAVKILSLPAEPPKGFSGAVGKFELNAEAATARGTVGDPLTLKIKISGFGNFDRVNAPALESSEMWKGYKPSEKFEADDLVGCSGAKTFEQTLVPLKSGKLMLPELGFCFFDPEAKQYVTLSTQPTAVDVSDGPTVSAPATSGPPPLTSTVARPPVAPGMVPNKLALGHFTATLEPWILNSWLAAAALAPSATFLCVYAVLLGRRRRTLDPRKARVAGLRREVQAQSGVMEQAAARGATTEFFAAARSALQHQLSVLWELPAQSITLAEVNTRMNGEADGFRVVLELADEVTYSGRCFSASELRKWSKIINAELRRLECK